MLSDNIVFATRGKNKKEKLSVSRQTVSKWEMDKRMDAYSNLRVEEVEGFSYVEHTVISNDPEADALSWIDRLSEKNGVTNPRVIGWDFPNISVEQMNVYHMHGYTAAWVLPVGMRIRLLQSRLHTRHLILL